MKILWKSLKSGLKSGYDGSSWKIGVWRIGKTPKVECVGFNASKRIVNAMWYVPCEIIAKVEADGEMIIKEDKITCEKMRIVEAWNWTKEESVRLAIYSAELVIDNYENLYKDDNSMRRTILVAKQWLINNAQQVARNACDTASSSAAYSFFIAALAEEVLEYVVVSYDAYSVTLSRIETYLQSRLQYITTL